MVLANVPYYDGQFAPRLVLTKAHTGESRLVIIDLT